jgi:catechol 2,3-dioxygenase-like lactoylglutathione lyase family enzyme
MKNTSPFPDFKIDFLDHVAIVVKDMETSARWYERVLGLRRYEPAAWRPFPTFLLAGKTGIALFPVKPEDTAAESAGRGIRIDHFAFQLSKEDFAKARKHYEDLGIEYRFNDHHYFHSIYTLDPDGHTVELTTLVVEEKAFYG